MGPPAGTPRGSGAKLAATDVAVVIECLRPFHRSQSGTLRNKVTKDRRGYPHRRHDVGVEVNDGRMRLRFSTGADADPSADEGLPPAAAKVRVRLIALARPVDRPRSCTHRRGRSCLHGQPTRRRYSLEQCLQNHRYRDGFRAGKGVRFRPSRFGSFGDSGEDCASAPTQARK